MTLGDILLIFTLILLNGFFVAVEFAAVASRRARLDLLADPSGAVSQQVHRWLDQPASRERLIAATQLGITVVSLALGAVGENAFEAWLEPYFHDAHFPQWLQFLDSVLPALPLALSLIIVTSLHVVLGEQVPKVAVLRAPERFMLTAAPFMRSAARNAPTGADVVLPVKISSIVAFISGSVRFSRLIALIVACLIMVTSSYGRSQKK